MESHDRLSQFGAYTKALELFDLVISDLSTLTKRPELQRPISQQYASADSIASNIEEGYGRGSKKEYAQFLVIAAARPGKRPVVTDVSVIGFRLGSLPRATHSATKSLPS